MLGGALRPISASCAAAFRARANSVVEVGGVRTLFRMPDLLLDRLPGGGSLAARDPLWVGPKSIGHRLTHEALVFGGGALTATDAAVAAGIAAIGDLFAGVADLPRGIRAGGAGAARERIEDAVDRIKTEAGDLPLVAVGGGAFLVPDRLAGAARVIRVPYGEHANVLGASDRANQRRDRPDLPRSRPGGGDCGGRSASPRACGRRRCRS